MRSNPATEIKVGIFVLLAVAALAYMTTKVSKGKIASDDMYLVSAIFDNVSGLKIGAPVEIAGIEVGLVKNIGLQQGKAEVSMAIQPGIKLRADSLAAIQTRGVLGDKYIELQQGSSAYPFLKPGDRMVRSDTPTDMNQLFDKVGQIADDIGLVARSVANVVGGPQGEHDLRQIVTNFRELSAGLNSMVQTNMQNISLIVSNLKDFSADMKSISGANKQGINKIVRNLEKASGDVRQTLRHMNILLGQLHEGQGPMARLVTDKQMGDEMKNTVSSLDSIARKIDEGKGTLGRLINDDTTSKELDKALEGINKYISKQDQFRTYIDAYSEYLTTGDLKSYFTVKLNTSRDKFYMLSLNTDPKGRTEHTDTERKSWTDGVYSHYKEEETVNHKDGLKFSAQIGRRWDDFVLRGGIIESSGGVGAEYYFWNDRVQLFSEIFDFGDDNPPQLKAGAKLYFRKNFYISAGVDDILSDTGDTAFFTGVGLYFSDDDLKYLLGSVPIPSN